MAATPVGAAAVAVGNTVATVTVPRSSLGTVSNTEVLVAHCWANNNTATWTADGFTLWANNTAVGSSVLYKVITNAASEPTNYVFTRSSGGLTAAAGVILVRLTGVNNTTPIDAGGTTSGTGGTITLGSLTTTGTSRRSLQTVTRAATGGASWTPPGDGSGTLGNPIERFEADSTGVVIRYAVGDDAVPSAGATGQRIWTQSGVGATRGMHVTLVETTGPSQGSAGGTFAYATKAYGAPIKPDTVTFAQVRTAIQNRNARRVNIGLFGASVVESYPAPPSLWVSTQLAQKLRTRYPTTGLGTSGGYGYIGFPSNGLENTATTPITVSGGSYNETWGYGGRHRVWVTSALQAATAYCTLTLPAAATQVKILTIATSAGQSTSGRYRINGGAYVEFSNYAASDSTHVIELNGSFAAGTTIEVSHNTIGTGNVILEGFYVSNGDESKGIQVHNHGHYGYRVSDWMVAATANDPSWVTRLKDYDLVVISDMGANDGWTGGGSPINAATFKTNLTAMVDHFRSSGYTGDMMIASLYDISYARTFVDPWSAYVDAMRSVAATKNIAFIQLDVFMPPSPNAIYDADNAHGNANGASNDLMSSLYLERVAPEGSIAAGAAGSASGSLGFTGSAVGAAPALPPRTGTASGSYAYVGTAVGQRVAKATAVGTYAYSGSATGTAPVVPINEGTASGTWSFAGTAAGSAPALDIAEGTASGTYLYTGTALGYSPSIDGATGVAAGTFGFTGTAAGRRTPKASASGSYAYAGTAIGSTDKRGTAGGTFAYVVTAAGTTARRGTATGEYAWTGAARGGVLRDITVTIGQPYTRLTTAEAHTRLSVGAVRQRLSTGAPRRTP